AGAGAPLAVRRAAAPRGGPGVRAARPIADGRVRRRGGCHGRPRRGRTAAEDRSRGDGEAQCPHHETGATAPTWCCAEARCTRPTPWGAGPTPWRYAPVASW